MKLTPKVFILLSAASAFAEAEEGSFTDTGTFELVEQLSLDQCFPSDIPWVNFKGNDYIFSRMQYNSECVDNEDRMYEWGAIEGVYPGTEDVCGTMCVKGHSSFEARGCSTSQRPDPEKLVGFNYDCDNATCYCLYERGTLSSKYDRCFNSMNTNDYGRGNVVYSTLTNRGRTCYSLHIQPSNPPAPKPRKPTRRPTRKPARQPHICTRELDFKCYKSGRPSCCDKNNGRDCPKEMTICDNHPKGKTGWNYCTNSPNYDCWKGGWPKCCNGNSLNCPRKQPGCDIKKKPTPRPTRKPARQPRGSSICTREPDFKCYKSGRPSCCDKNKGRDCPKEMTKCDNHPENWTGGSYCTNSPNYDCWKGGWPSCCNGNSKNCPRKQPRCDNKKTSTEALASQRFLRTTVAA